MSDYQLTKKFKLDDLMESTNIADMMPDADRAYIGSCVTEWFEDDDRTRKEWKERSKFANELALQVVNEKTEPWIGCSNVKFPLVTVAALQYQALAYPAIIDAPDLVKCMVYGEDMDGQKTAKAARISAHMSWQNMEQDTGWEEAHDKGLLVQGIMGDAFFKKVFDPVCRHNVTQLVLPANFVCNYYTRDIATSPRYTHVFELSENDIRQRELDGRFVEPPNGPLPKSETAPDDQLKEAQDRRQGITPSVESAATPYNTGEMYCWWDLDGDDYAEPYIVTFDIGTGFVRRIVARYLPDGVRYVDNGPSRKVYAIDPVQVFTRCTFIPSPDGGFYSIGLGHILGPINESVNTAINQLFDAGTMSTLGGGFTARGFKARGGPFTFKPNQWHPTDMPGDDIRKGILPLPVREPSPVLFQLIGLLLQYGERIISTNEIQAGESPGQNTPAETTRTLDANGRRMVNSVYKRTWRAFRDEYRIQFSLNAKFLEVSENYTDLTTGAGAMIRPDDYLGQDISVKPAADPYIISDAQRAQEADKLLQAAQSLPGFNRYQTGLRWLKANKVQDIQTIYKPPMGPDGKPLEDFPPPGPDAKMIQAQVAQQKFQLEVAEFQAEQALKPIEFMLQAREMDAHIAEMLAHAEELKAKASSELMEPTIKLIYAGIERERGRRDDILRKAELSVDAILQHKKITADARAKGVNTPAVTSPSDAIKQSIGQTMSTA